MLKSHTYLPSPALRLLITALFGLAALFALAMGWRLGPGLSRLSLDETPGPGLSQQHYAALFTRAMGENEAGIALLAARRESEAAPHAYGAWQRRALAATAVAGGPSREALASMMEAYRLAPYPAPADMAWRVEYAVRYEATIPNQLTGLTLTQIKALGGMPETWDRRKAWCKTFPEGTFASAACATTPGVWRNGVKQ